MGSGMWDRRYFAGTRGQILALLRRAPRTVDDMAQELDLTGNAIRAQLTVLERDGLVEQQGFRRVARKPSLLYRLTSDAERMFPKAHEELVPYLLDILKERSAPDGDGDELREVGRRMAAAHPTPAGDLDTKLQHALSLLRSLGGLPEAEETPKGIEICGYSCPFSPVVQTHPELCKVAEGMLSEVLGVRVQERCERSGSLWCRFEIPNPVVEE